MRGNFEQMTTLQYRCRSLSKQVDDFKSGEKYRQMEEAYKKLLRFHNKEMKRMKYELSKAHSETVTVRKYWSEVMDDLEKEYQKEVRRLLTEIEHLKKENLKLAGQRDEAKDIRKKVWRHLWKMDVFQYQIIFVKQISNRLQPQDARGCLRIHQKGQQPMQYCIHLLKVPEQTTWMYTST